MTNSECPLGAKPRYSRIFPPRSVGRLLGKITSMVLIVVAICAWGGSAGGDEKIPKSMVSGNEYLRLSPENRHTYVLGLYDGIQLAKLFGARNKRFYGYIDQEDMTGWQIRAIVDKYLKDNPQEWNKPMNYIFFFALQPSKLP